MTRDAIDRWVRIAERLGIATVCCAFLFFAIWHAASWVAIEVVKPVLDEQLAIMRTSREAQAVVPDALNRVASAMDAIRKDSAETREILRVMLAERPKKAPQ